MSSSSYYEDSSSVLKEQHDMTLQRGLSSCSAENRRAGVLTERLVRDPPEMTVA